MAREYRRWLLEEGYVVVVRDAEGCSVLLTEKARELLRYYYEKLERALSGPSLGKEHVEDLEALLEKLFD